jgi:hypothetical protein
MIGLFKQHMAGLSGVEIYPIIAFLIFFITFLAVIVRTYRADDAEIKTVSNLPLEGDQTQLP